MDEFEDYFERDDRKAEVKVSMSSEYLNGTDVCVPSVMMCSFTDALSCSAKIIGRKVRARMNMEAVDAAQNFARILVTPPCFRINNSGAILLEHLQKTKMAAPSSQEQFLSKTTRASVQTYDKLAASI